MTRKTIREHQATKNPDKAQPAVHRHSTGHTPVHKLPEDWLAPTRGCPDRSSLFPAECFADFQPTAPDSASPAPRRVHLAADCSTHCQGQWSNAGSCPSAPAPEGMRLMP